jgi:hypothetical protein
MYVGDVLAFNHPDILSCENSVAGRLDNIFPPFSPALIELVKSAQNLAGHLDHLPWP